MNDQKNKILLLFTVAYPYSAVSESFLDPEIPYLSSVFQQIILIPTSIPTSNEKTERMLPKNVTIDNSFITSNDGRNELWQKVTNVIQSKLFYREISKKIPYIMFRSSIGSLIDHLDMALKTEKWLINYLTKNKLDLSKTIFYTYWLSGITTGIARVKKNYPEIKLISRAHGGDLYEDRYNPPYIPFRPEVFQHINKIFLISNHGKQYLITRYPMVEQICSVMKLGVPDPHFSTKSSSDKIIRILSCSYAYPIKRINLIIEGLAELGKMKPDQKIKWIQIGDGPLLSELKEKAQQMLTKNIECQFLGFLCPEKVIQYYKDNNIDIFINTSSYEGIPVSIMEAQSFGIPAIATSVGGTSEIVSEDTGILLSKTPTPNEIASALCLIIENREKFMEKKENSKKNWERYYHSEKNFSEFALQLIDL